MTADTSSKTASERFHERIHDNYIYGLWELASQMTVHPMPKMKAHIWKWSLFESVLAEAGEVVPIGDERRALQLFNPGLEGRWATTNSLLGAIQMLLPGETARAHRHTPTAIRFIIEGTNAYTAVDGERVYMKPGDLVLTPSWTWHDHGNLTNERVVWFDGLDVPLIQSLEAMFFELYDVPQVPLRKADNESERLHAHSHLTPTWVKEKPLSSPLLIYAWDKTYEALMAAREQPGSPYDGICLEYQHPQTGGPVLPTMACFIQLIRPGERLRAHRHTGSAVYLVERGNGETIIDGVRFSWGKGDVLVVPPWAAHEHANTSRSEDAILFSIQDTPVLEKLGLDKAEAYEENGGHQVVTANYEAVG
ncbi:MAG TPA: cupin domain-containing protein [Dehalococcoidia bacterium]|nr:cupin domain-containing protein [Dehalococcoidia bacterium]